MLDRELIGKIRFLKAEKGYTLHELSKLLDMQVSTLGRWLKTEHINKVYAHIVRQKLNIK